MVEEDRGKQELRVYPQPVHMLAQVRGGLEVVELNEYLEGKVGQRVHYTNVLRPESLPKRLQTRRLQAITGQVPVHETIMRLRRHKGMDLPEEYMRGHCGEGQETYEHFMWCAQYKGIEEPLVRDQDVPLLKKGARGRSAVERELGKEGHRKGLWHMVIVKPLWRALQEHTVAPEAIAHRLLRRMVEHLQERMACRETQLDAGADYMRDPVTKQGGDGVDQVQPKNHGDGSTETARLAAKAVRGRHGNGRQRARRAERTPDRTQTKENPADMRAGQVYGFAAQGDVRKGTGGKGTAEAPVAWTRASGTGHAES